MKRGTQVRFGLALLVMTLMVTACGSNAEPARTDDGIPTPSAALSTDVAATPPNEPSSTPTREDDTSPKVVETRRPEPTVSVMSPCTDPEHSGGGGATRRALERPTNATLVRADSWVAIGGFTELVWASHWIIQARIVGCTDGEMGFTEYVVDVERTFRGEPRPTFVLQDVGDRYGSRPPPAIGDEFVLFIGSDATWVMGGPQGTFYIEDGLVGAEYSSMALTLEEFGQAIAVALSGDPPESLPVPLVTLEESPPGPDLSAPAAGRPSGCGGTLTPGSFQGRETLRLVWSSQHVFAGTVIEQLPSVRVELPEHETDPLLRPVITEYLVRIEDPIRGLPDDVIRVRRLGGDIEGCSVTNREGQLLEVGQRALLFVWTPDQGSADPTYYLNGGSDGFWRFADGEALAVQSDSDYRSSTLVPMRNFANGLLAALQGGPPEDDGYGLPSVPLDAAPAAPARAWPELLPDSSTSWAPFQHPTLGIGFDYPESWSIHEATDSGALSIASYETVGGDWESIPDGGLRIDIGPLDRPGYTQTPLSVGRAALPGYVYFFGLMGDTYHVYITYEVDDQLWQIAGYFKEPADLDNPNTRLLLAIVESVAHGSE
jgi:hypothetical protein